MEKAKRKVGKGAFRKSQGQKANATPQKKLGSRVWLAKSEADTYSIDDLKRDGRTLWEGVRNYQARNFLRDEWQVGDTVLFYHSNSEPTGIAGIAQVTKAQVPDPSQFDKKSDYYDPKAKAESPTWFAPEIKFVKKFARPVTLEHLKSEKRLKDMGVLKRGNRLSVQPVSYAEFKVISELAAK